MNPSARSILLAFFALSTVALAGQHQDASPQVYNSEGYGAIAAPVENAPIQAVQEPSDTPVLAAPQNQAADTPLEEGAAAPAESASVTVSVEATITSAISSEAGSSSSGSSSASVAPSEATSAPSEAVTTVSSSVEAASSTAQAALVGTTTDISATRTISVAEASALAQAQAASPNMLPDDANTQDVLAQAQAWADEVAASNTGSDNGSSPAPPAEAPAGGQTTTTLEGCAETVVPVSGDTCDGIESRLGLEKGTLIRLSGGRINSECLNMLADETYCVRSA